MALMQVFFLCFFADLMMTAVRIDAHTKTARILRLSSVIGQWVILEADNLLNSLFHAFTSCYTISYLRFWVVTTLGRLNFGKLPNYTEFQN